MGYINNVYNNAYIIPCTHYMAAFWLALIEDKIEERSSLEADNATYELDVKINELKGRYKWLKSNMVE